MSLNRVVVVLAEISPGEALVSLIEVDQRLRLVLPVGGLRELFGRGEVVETADPEHVKHQHRVVGHHRPTRLADDGGVLHAGIVTHRLEVVHHVVGVLFEAVIGAGFAVGLRAVVIDAEAAADVDRFEARP